VNRVQCKICGDDVTWDRVEIATKPNHAMPVVLYRGCAITGGRLSEAGRTFCVRCFDEALRPYEA